MDSVKRRVLSLRREQSLCREVVGAQLRTVFGAQERFEKSIRGVKCALQSPLFIKETNSAVERAWQLMERCGFG